MARNGSNDTLSGPGKVGLVARERTIIGAAIASGEPINAVRALQHRAGRLAGALERFGLLRAAHLFDPGLKAVGDV